MEEEDNYSWADLQQESNEQLLDAIMGKEESQKRSKKTPRKRHKKSLRDHRRDKFSE